MLDQSFTDKEQELGIILFDLQFWKLQFDLRGNCAASMKMFTTNATSRLPRGLKTGLQILQIRLFPSDLTLFLSQEENKRKKRRVGQSFSSHSPKENFFHRSSEPPK